MVQMYKYYYQKQSGSFESEILAVRLTQCYFFQES